MERKDRTIPKFFWFFLGAIFFATPCFAQDASEWEFFAGYSYKRANVREYFRSTPITYSIRTENINLNGWDLSVTENRNRRIGGTLDLSGHYVTTTKQGVANRRRVHTLLYGPRFSFRKSWGVPFAHVLLGVAHSDARVIPVGPRDSDFAFAGAAGVGLDMKFGKLNVRVLQADYVHTGALGVKSHSYRLSAGVVFYAGDKK